MTQKFDHIDASEPVSTVTKHIKIYSDNPIHDCIDRIINCAARLDEGIGSPIINYQYLKTVTRELNRIAHQNLYQVIKKEESELDEQRPN